jgi:hypothetical protein
MEASVVIVGAAASTNWEANSGGGEDAQRVLTPVVVEVSRRPISGGRTKAFCWLPVILDFGLVLLPLSSLDMAQHVVLDAWRRRSLISFLL